VLEHIENDLTEADGSFRRADQKGPESSYLYSAGWLAWGSVALGRFDLGRRFARQMMLDQDSQWGGFWNEFGHGRVQWLLNSSSAVAGCAAAGEIEAAVKGSHYLELMLERQPEAERGFHFYLSPGGQIVTALIDNEVFGSALSFYDYGGRVAPAMFAVALAALVWTGQQTGDDVHFDRARKYADVMLAASQDPTKSPFASKMGWATMLLYRHRPDPDLMDYARGVGRAMLERQTPGGAVSLEGWDGLEPEMVSQIVEPVTCDWTLTTVALANGAA
jgi:hypothetical protein